jgi:two-component system response regulator AtoC
VVDDKSIMREPVVDTLILAGYEVLGFEGVSYVKEEIQKRVPDAIVTDLSMPGETGIELASWCQSEIPSCPVILMTAYATVETAVTAMKEGAYDYLTKPFDADELEIIVKRALESSRLRKENQILKQSLVTRDTESLMVGRAASLMKIKQELPLVATSNSNVLVLGASGTGKEVLAKEIHRLSKRKDKIFMAVNCSALSAGLLESELFGHEKGSFTGADVKRCGRFEMADGGTLLLDEITEMDVNLQAKLLRVLQERVIERVGSAEPIPVDVRVIATSNRNMEEAVREGHLRRDLYYRLDVVKFVLPSLKDRKEDLLDLVSHFLSIHGGGQLKISEEVIQAIQAYDWPGNIRELSNAVERACVLSDPRAMIPVVALSSRLNPDDDPNELTALDIEYDNLTLEEMEKTVIRRTLEKFNGRRNVTAKHLGIAERTLRDKIKRWQLK